jgi:hypothetical protein
MNMIKRGLIALSVVAAVGGTTGGLLASAASAQPTRGPEILTGSQYAVGDGVAVGPFSEHGVVHNRGNVTDIPSLPADPANSNRHTLVDPTGSFTLLTTGGTGPAAGPSVNPVTCAVHFTIRNIDAKIVSGTGAYANATGRFKATASIRGFLSRTATGACDTNQNDPPAFSTTTVFAKGHINLHQPKPAHAS